MRPHVSNLPALIEHSWSRAILLAHNSSGACSSHSQPLFYFLRVSGVIFVDSSNDECQPPRTGVPERRGVAVDRNSSCFSDCGAIHSPVLWGDRGILLGQYVLGVLACGIVLCGRVGMEGE